MEDKNINLYWNSKKQVFIDYGVTYPKFKTPKGITYDEYCKEPKSHEVNEEAK
jgi:hypothetical protein